MCPKGHGFTPCECRVHHAAGASLRTLCRHISPTVGGWIHAGLSKGESKTYCLSLPERTTYSLSSYNGIVEGESSFRVDTWYDRDSCTLYITVTGEETGSGMISFFIDGEYYCEIDVSVGYRSGSAEESHQVDLTFDYASLENMDVQTSFTGEELSDLFQDGFSYGGNP